MSAIQEAPAWGVKEQTTTYSRTDSLWVVLGIALLLAPSAVWIGSDHSVWPWDQAWFGEVSVDLWHWFTHSPFAWARSMLLQMNLKPPAIVWLGQLFVPLRHVFGTVENALLASILLTEFVLLLLVYSIGRRISDSKWIAFGGVAFAASGQCFVGLSTQYMAEPLQGLAVAWVLWTAFRSGDWPLPRIVLNLACALLLGMLAKASTPLYCFVFCFYIAYKCVSRPWKFKARAEWDHWPSRALIVAFAAVLPGAVAWYAFNYNAVLEHIRISSSGDTAVHFGFRADAWTKLALWLRYTWQAFLAPYLFWIMIAALVAAALFAIRSRAQRPQSGAMALAVLSTLQIWIVLWVFSLNDAVEPRYLYAIAAHFAVIIMVLCSLVPFRRAAGIVLLLVCAAQWLSVHSFVLHRTQSIAGEFPWAVQVHRDTSEYRDLERIVNATTINERYNIIGVDVKWLNSNSAGFFAAKHRLDAGVRSYYTSLGFNEESTARALKRMEEFRTQCFITLDEPFQEKPPNFLNLVAQPVLRAVQQDPQWERETFPNEKGVLVFKRRPSQVAIGW